MITVLDYARTVRAIYSSSKSRMSFAGRIEKNNAIVLDKLEQ